MTPIGHSIAGVTIGLMAMPQQTPRRRAAIFLALCAVLANVPDFPLPYWGHERYDISHSVFVNLALIVLCTVCLLVVARVWRKTGNAWLIAGGAAAWLSHLLLDSFYNHGQGISILWPFSVARLVLPLPWFRVLPHPLPYVDADALHIMAVEAVIYGMVLVAVAVAQQVLAKSRPRAGMVSPS